MSGVPERVPPNDEILIEIALSNEDSSVYGSVWVGMNDPYLTVSLKFENQDVSVSIGSWSDTMNKDVPKLLRSMADHVEARQAEADKPWDPNDIPF